VLIESTAARPNSGKPEFGRAAVFVIGHRKSSAYRRARPNSWFLDNYRAKRDKSPRYRCEYRGIQNAADRKLPTVL
jgi:hypothetical protein